MTVIAFTGIRHLTPSQRQMVVSVIQCLNADKYVSGGALGVDTVAALAAHKLHPEANHLLVSPAGFYNKAVQAYFQLHRLEWESMPPGSSYLDRNQRMIDLADVLVAFPHHEIEELRSGTWATIRRARKKGIPVHLYPLS